MISEPQDSRAKRGVDGLFDVFVYTQNILLSDGRRLSDLFDFGERIESACAPHGPEPSTQIMIYEYMKNIRLTRGRLATDPWHFEGERPGMPMNQEPIGITVLNRLEDDYEL